VAQVHTLNMSDKIKLDLDLIGAGMGDKDDEMLADDDAEFDFPEIL